MREDWVECSFEDLLDYEQPTKYIVKSTKYNDNYKTPVLTAGKSFIKGYTNETSGVFNNLPTIIFDDFTTASKYVDFEFKVKSSAMKILVPTSKLVNMKFVFYGMQVNKIRNDTHKRYWISVFAKKKFLLPPLPIQRAIVHKIENLFASLDKGIADLKKAQEQLKVYRQAVLKKAFEGELTKEWREKHVKTDVRPSQAKTNTPIAAEPTTSYINKSVNKLPNSWSWIKLGDACNSVEYGTSTKSSDIGKTPVLRMGNIQNGRIDWADLKYTDDDSEIEKYRLNHNDVLFNRTNSAEHVGKTAIYKGEKEAIFAGYLIRINYKSEVVSPDFLNYYLNSHEAKQYGNQVKSFGVNQSNINGTKLKKYPFPLPQLEEQRQIVREIESRLSVCDKVEQNINEGLEKSEALRQSILKKAFEGKLLSEAEIEKCKQEADYEPACVLLEKIKK
jgi:type I restriction enzyme, S subunit